MVKIGKEKPCCDRLLGPCISCLEVRMNKWGLDPDDVLAYSTYGAIFFFRIIIKFKKKIKIVAVGLCTACTIFSLIQGTRSCSVHSGTCRFASLSYPLHHSVHPNVNDIAVPPADMTPMMTLMSMMTLL